MFQAECVGVLRVTVTELMLADLENVVCPLLLLGWSGLGGMIHRTSATGAYLVLRSSCYALMLRDMVLLHRSQASRGIR